MSVLAALAGNPVEKKSVLLVDIHARSRESRAKTMRKLGASVDCAANAMSALQQFAISEYRLVLIDMGADEEAAERLARDIRRKQPKQLVGFMVEGPMLISKTFVPTGRNAPAARSNMPQLVDPDESDFGRAVKKAEDAQRE